MIHITFPDQAIERKLKARFQKLDIWITSYPIDVL